MTEHKAPHPVDIHVGSRVRLRRMMLGLSQEKLGEQLGITFQQIQKYEKGPNRISAARLHAIGKALGAPVEFFFDGIEDGSKGDVIAAEVKTLDLALARRIAAVQDGRIKRALLNLINDL